jgi:hypothetical protein
MMEYHSAAAFVGSDPTLQPADDLCARVEAEFREMPGLRLTLPQAARLFGIEAARCERVLDALVHAGALATDGRAFARAPRPARTRATRAPLRGA